MDAGVPNLILQPLVENAIRHGIAPRPQTGHIEIRARRENGALRVEIMDDGPGLAGDSSVPQREGVGLTNTRARLRQLYGNAHQFTFANRAGGGFVVTVCVPFREIPDEIPQAELDISTPRLPAPSRRIAAPESL
jgi:sensor histidine kinase YesM